MEKELSYNQHVSHLPRHLLQYVVDQNYSHYSAIDQAVWRYVMRQNVNYLPAVCHGSYLEGLKKTGLSTEEIPSMYGMTRILKEIGWFAVAVDGFIPPTVFMEFQAYNVLVIAADIRQINHIGYTPAPDILHEAAGHAPIIADNEYSNYLKRFGEIGSKAFSSSEDIELFDAIRELSILKEAPNIDSRLIEKAEHRVLNLQSAIHSLSEMAKIRNLHWWTVEYGLIGSLDNPKIYGAGLLSSISESVNCLSDKVEKIPYDINAADIVFDITKEQPQLFVAQDFKHLNNVLDQFSNKMAFKRGGDYAIELAIDSKSISTCEFNTGVQISGTFEELIKINNKGVYLRTKGATALSYGNKEIKNHGIKNHAEGFGVPIGNIVNMIDLVNIKSQINTKLEIIYDSGIVVKGHLFDIVEDGIGNMIILSFKNCSVILPSAKSENTILFDPCWGVFDLVIGQKIISAYPSPADRDSFPIEKIELTSHTIHPIISDKEKRLQNLYSSVRKMRNGDVNLDSIAAILNELISEFEDDWLLMVEICELVKYKNDKLYNLAYLHLMSILEKHPEHKKLILDGLSII